MPPGWTGLPSWAERARHPRPDGACKADEDERQSGDPQGPHLAWGAAIAVGIRQVDAMPPSGHRGGPCHDCECGSSAEDIDGPAIGVASAGADTERVDGAGCRNAPHGGLARVAGASTLISVRALRDLRNREVGASYDNLGAACIRGVAGPMKLHGGVGRLGAIGRHRHIAAGRRQSVRSVIRGELQSARCGG